MIPLLKGSNVQVRVLGTNLASAPMWFQMQHWSSRCNGSQTGKGRGAWQRPIRLWPTYEAPHKQALLTFSASTHLSVPSSTYGAPYRLCIALIARTKTLQFRDFNQGLVPFDYRVAVVHLKRIAGETNGTIPVLIRGPANFDGTGKIKGVEVSYQQTFDFLPGLLSGFVFNGNYSYIESQGLPNSFLNGGTPSNASPITPGNLPLEGLSKHNVNATVFYEKGPVSLRAAYNWRSRFLLTAADVIFPYTSIYNDETGQLDASAFINLNKYIKIGVQGVNLTNESTRTLQAYTGNPDQLAPRSYFINDRRFSFILRGNF